jgi:hypothetical protein
MPKYAVLNGNTVINFIIADSKEIADNVTKLNCVECPPSTKIDVGGVYNFENKRFEEVPEITETE